MAECLSPVVGHDPVVLAVTWHGWRMLCMP
jgi:hypothetical protein